MATILVVDDEPVVHTVITEGLEGPGRDFHTASTVAEALKVAGSFERLDLAIVDKNLPDRSGLELIEELKRRFPWAEVIMITGYPSMESAVEAFRVGAFDYVGKPIELEELNLKIQNAIEKVDLRYRERQLRERLYESEERYRSLFGSVQDAILLLDSDSGTIYDANDAAEKMYGYSREELAGRPVRDLWTQQQGEGVASLLKAEEVRRLFCQHKRRDGTVFFAEVSSSVFSIGDKHHRYLIVRNMSDYADAQQQQSIKMEALGRLVGGVVHDFNNQLTVINANANLLAEELPDTSRDANSYLKDILASVVDAAAMTRQLLSFSRKQAARKEALDLAEAVRHLGGVLRRTIPERVKLHLIEPGGPMRVLINPTDASQIVMNLVINAVDAMAGGGTISIGLQRVNLEAELVHRDGVVRKGAYILLTVADTGEGIPEAVLPRIFEPFFTTKGPGRSGTGLGLSTVYGIVGSTGGAILCDSEVGRGTTFRIYLPCIEASGVTVDTSAGQSRMAKG